MNLRPYQLAQLDAIERSYLAGIRQQIISAATGTGKTVLFSQIPKRMRWSTPA